LKDGSKWEVKVEVQASTNPAELNPRGLNTVAVFRGAQPEMTGSTGGNLNPADVTAHVPGHEVGHMIGLVHPGEKGQDGKVGLTQESGTVMGDPWNLSAKPSSEEASLVGRKAGLNIDRNVQIRENQKKVPSKR